LDARYLDYPNGPQTYLEQYCSQTSNAYCTSRFPGGAGQFHDLSGSQMLNAPKWSGTLSASYSHDIWSGYRLTGEVSGIGSSNWYYNILDNLDGAYWMMGARLTVASPDKHWFFDVIGKNLNDRVVQASGYEASTQTTKQEPRSVAAQIRYQFR